MAQNKRAHTVPLWGLFLALLALTGAEVGLYEFWRQSGELDGVYFIPKFAVVILILIFTLPKALIVLIYFMHLKFEKLTIVSLAIAPFITAGIAVLSILSDTKALQDQTPRRSRKELQEQAYIQMSDLQDFSVRAHHSKQDAGDVPGGAKSTHDQSTERSAASEEENDSNAQGY